MNAMVLFLGLIPTWALAGCEMDAAEMNDAGSAELATDDEELHREFEDDSLGLMDEGEPPEMEVATFLQGVSCDEVFDFVDAGVPAGFFALTTFSYHAAPVHDSLGLLQGALHPVPVSNGVRVQSSDIQARDMRSARTVRIDLVKNKPRFQLPYTSIRMQTASATRYLDNVYFAPQECQRFANYATVLADSSDGSRLLMTYRYHSFGG